MIENPPIIQDIRKIRKAISEKFGHDPDRYIDYLISSQKPLASENDQPGGETEGNSSTATNAT